MAAGVKNLGPHISFDLKAIKNHRNNEQWESYSKREHQCISVYIHWKA